MKTTTIANRWAANSRAFHSIVLLALLLVAFGKGHAANCVEQSSEPTLLHLSSTDSEFKVQGTFDGWFRVYCDSIEIEFKAAEIKIPADTPFRSRELIGDVRIALGTGTIKSWNASEFVRIAKVDKVIGPGESIRFRIGVFRLPLKRIKDLSKRWLVIQMSGSENLSGLGPFGTSYVHSDRDVFVPAEAKK